jgi:hypothetical protein
MAALEAERARIPTGVDMMNIACVGYEYLARPGSVPSIATFPF